jgi:hypothetical protein
VLLNFWTFQFFPCALVCYFWVWRLSKNLVCVLVSFIIKVSDQIPDRNKREERFIWLMLSEVSVQRGREGVGEQVTSRPPGTCFLNQAHHPQVHHLPRVLSNLNPSVMKPLLRSELPGPSPLRSRPHQRTQRGVCWSPRHLSTQPSWQSRVTATWVTNPSTFPSVHWPCRCLSLQSALSSCLLAGTSTTWATPPALSQCTF